MIGELESFGNLLLARRAGGEPVELVRSPEELVFLAFDSQIKRLVELHILRSGKTLDSVAKRSAFDRAQQASMIRGPSFMRILEVGEDQGLVYYTSNLNDGEFVSDYTRRRGPLPPATVFSLVFQLLDDLIQLKDYQRLVAHMRLDRVVVSTLEDTFLQLRIYDYGLSAIEPEAAEENSGPALVVQACELLFLMLTGSAFTGDNPDRYPAVTALPMNLRTTMRAALTDPANAPASITKVRDDVREAFGSLVSSIQVRNSRKHLVVTPALQPRSQLQDLLLENVPVEIILGNRFRAEDPDQVRRYPFSIPCINTKNEQNVTVHLLPPSRIVDKAQYEAVPLQMWRFNAERHPNILRSLSLWESPDWTFLTEEREPGFALSRLLAERICLNPAEVVVLLRQVRAGLEQALECGVQRVDLHPSNIVLRVGKAGPLLLREYERLMQKRIDAWPPFLVKLRAHLTMRNLYEPLLVDKPEQGEHEESHLADRDYRHRTFVALAAYLLTGERQTGGVPRFPEAVPEPLAAFVRESMELTKQVGRTPNLAEFLDQFEAVMNGPVAPDLATRLRGATVAIEEMESAGSVSDFDEEWPASGDDLSDAGEPKGPVARSLNVSHFNTPGKQGIKWPAWIAAAVVTSGLLGWWLIPHFTKNRAVVVSIPTQPVPGPDASSPGLAAKTQAPEVLAKVEKKPETKPALVVNRPPLGSGPAKMALKPELASAPPEKMASLPTPPPVFANVPQLAKTDTANAGVTTKPAIPVRVHALETSKPTVLVAQPAVPIPPKEVVTAGIPVKTPPSALPEPPPSLPATPAPPPPAPIASLNKPEEPATIQSNPVIVTATLPLPAPISFAPLTLPPLASKTRQPASAARLPTLAMAPQVPFGIAKPAASPAAVSPPLPRAVAVKSPAVMGSPSAADEVKSPQPSPVGPPNARLTDAPPPAAASPVKAAPHSEPEVAGSSPAEAKTPAPKATPPAAVPSPQQAPNQVIIRKAILPTPEEIAKFKAAQAADPKSNPSNLNTAQTSSRSKSLPPP